MDGGFFRCDSARCVRCGACIGDCGFKALRADAEGRPVMAKPERCMRCQHCFAVCPTGAISIDGHTAEEAIPTEGLLLPSGEAARNYLRMRRSMRHFAKEDVDLTVLEDILKTLGNSPTGCNARNLTFHCWPDRASLDRFRATFVETLARHRGAHMLPRWLAVPAINLRRGREDIFFRGASGLLVVSSDERNPAVATPVEDTVIACSNFELLANAHGIGTCWFGFLRHAHAVVPELLGETLGLRPNTPFYGMLFGVPSLRHPRTVCRDSYADVRWM